jgi:hypothetical protein
MSAEMRAADRAVIRELIDSTVQVSGARGGEGLWPGGSRSMRRGGPTSLAAALRRESRLPSGIGSGHVL